MAAITVPTKSATLSRLEALPAEIIEQIAGSGTNPNLELCSRHLWQTLATERIRRQIIRRAFLGQDEESLSKEGQTEVLIKLREKDPARDQPYCTDLTELIARPWFLHHLLGDLSNEASKSCVTLAEIREWAYTPRGQMVLWNPPQWTQAHGNLVVLAQRSSLGALAAVTIARDGPDFFFHGFCSALRAQCLPAIHMFFDNDLRITNPLRREIVRQPHGPHDSWRSLRNRENSGLSAMAHIWIDTLDHREGSASNRWGRLRYARANVVKEIEIVKFTSQLIDWGNQLWGHVSEMRMSGIRQSYPHDPIVYWTGDYPLIVAELLKIPRDEWVTRRFAQILFDTSTMGAVEMVGEFEELLRRPPSDIGWADRCRALISAVAKVSDHVREMYSEVRKDYPLQMRTLQWSGPGGDSSDWQAIAVIAAGERAIKRAEKILADTPSPFGSYSQ